MFINVVMHGTSANMQQMQSQAKKRRMDWDPLELNDNGNGNSVIAAVDAKMPNLQADVKHCERVRAKNVNDGK